MPAEPQPQHGFVTKRDGPVRDTSVIEMRIERRRAAFPNWLCVALLALLCGLVATDVAWSQAAKPKAKPAGGAGAKPAVPKGSAAPLVIDPEALPPNYTPPKDRNPLLELDMPIALPDELEKLKKEDGKFQGVLNKAESDDAAKAVIKAGIRYRLAQMTLKENYQAENAKKGPYFITTLRNNLRRDLNGAGSAAKLLKAEAIKEFRRNLMLEFVKQAAPLLENNLHVRIQVIVLMGELELVVGDPSKGIATEAFTPVFDTFVKVILDPKQDVSVKIAAVNGLTRILKIGTANVNERTRIAEAVISELDRVKAADHPSESWYEFRLVGTLGSATLDQLKQPIIVTALKKVVSDPKRSWTVRTEAAKALGRVPLPPASNPASVVFAVSEMALQLAKAAQQAPADPQWKSAFWKTYLAFWSVDANEKDVTKAIKAGLLNNPVVAGGAKAASSHITPLCATILKGGRLTAAQLQALEAWVAANAQGAVVPPVPNP
ncbi:MAG: hypothetical protein DWH84_05120 [Planctomycetota bacterium]|nr:MAG: hypothetical protein DWH84_05120 [Planctomycetota bacterium]